MKPNYRDGTFRKTFSYNGKRYQVTAPTYEELILKVNEKQKALQSGAIVVNKNTKVEMWIDFWLETYKKPKVKESTYLDIESLMNNHVIPEIGDVSIGDVKRTNLQRILNSKTGKSYSLLSKIRIYLTDLFNSAEIDEIIDKNPARFLELPEYTKGTARAMTDEEYSAALELCKTHRAGLWIALMLRCGLRRGETVPLEWSDIDTKKGVLTINKSVEMVKGVPQLNDSAKSISGNRKISIPNDVMELIETARFKKKCELVFTPEQSESMLTDKQTARLWNSFKRSLDIAVGAELYRNKIIETKITGLKLHGLRHTAITKLVEAGADVKDVQYFAGHADVQTTLNVYAQVNKDRAADRILKIQNQVNV